MASCPRCETIAEELGDSSIFLRPPRQYRKEDRRTFFFPCSSTIDKCSDAIMPPRWMMKKRRLRVVCWKPMTSPNFLMEYADHKIRADCRACATIANPSLRSVFCTSPTTSQLLAPNSWLWVVQTPSVSCSSRNPACQRASLSMMGGFERSRARFDASKKSFKESRSGP